MKYAFHIFLLVTVLHFFGCSNSQKLMDDGNYEKSLKTSLKKLNKGKGNDSDKAIVNQSLNNLYNENIEKILESENGTSLEDGSNAHAAYSDLITQFSDAQKYLSTGNKDRLNALYTASDKLALELYADYKLHGEDYLTKSKENENREEAKVAYEHFQIAQQYNATPEIKLLMDESYDIAVVILCVEIDAPYNPSYEFDIERHFKRVENREVDFQQIYFNRNQSKADCIIEVRFDRFDPQRRYNNFDREFSRDVATERVVTNSQGESVTTTVQETVYCNVATNQTIHYLGMEAEVFVHSENGNCRPSRNDYRDYIENIYEEYQVTGDRRALPNQYDRRDNGQRILERDLVDRLVQKFYYQFSNEYL